MEEVHQARAAVREKHAELEEAKAALTLTQKFMAAAGFFVAGGAISWCGWMTVQVNALGGLPAAIAETKQDSEEHAGRISDLEKAMAQMAGDRLRLVEYYSEFKAENRQQMASLTTSAATHGQQLAALGAKLEAQAQRLAELGAKIDALRH